MERVRRVGGPLAVLVALVVLAGACGGGGEDGGGQAAETAVEAADVVIAPDGPPRRGGSVVYALASETDGWDPTVNRWATDGTQVALTFFDPLAAYNADGEAVPYLAESITPNGDFTEWTITLRPGIRFHDGTELNAAAVKTMFDAREKSVLTGPALALIETVETTGDLSLVVRMNGPWAAFPVALTGQAGVVPAPSQLASPDSSRKPIGTGPFRFVEWVPDNRLVVERNPDYWLRDEAGNQMPYLDRIEFRPIPDDTARSAAVTTGDVDIAHTGAVSSIKQFRELAAAGKLQYVEQRGDTEVTFVQLNLATPPFDDLRARRAVALATDNQAWVDVIAQGVTTRATSVFRPSSKWYVDAGFPAFDLAAATEEVAAYEADTGRPLTFTLSVIGTPLGRQQGEFLKQMWEQAGMQVEVRQVDAATLIVDGALGNYQATMWSQFGSPDPDYEQVWWDPDNARPVGEISLNFPRNRDPEINTALERARATDDATVRKEAYATVQRRLAATVPYVLLDYPTPVKVAQNRVRGLLQTTLPDGSASIPIGGPGSFSLVTRLTQVWVVD